MSWSSPTAQARRPAARIWRDLAEDRVTALGPPVLAGGAGEVIGPPSTGEPSVEEQLAAARAEGYAEGYQAAWSEAAEQGRAELAEALRQLAEAVEVAASQVAVAHAEALAVAEADVVNLALDLAEAVLDRELALQRAPVVDALRRSLRLAPETGPVAVRLHPEDLARLQEADGLHALGPVLGERSVEVVPDDQVAPGGCVLEAGPCRIDAQIPAALARARAALAGLGLGPAAGEDPPESKGTEP
jgi:flagellar assembly protein FliH